MRYLIAIVCAIAGALAATLFLSSMVAGWAVGSSSFDSPDQVSNFEDMAFIVTSLAGLVVGWLVGWGLGGALGVDRDADETDA